MSVSRVTYDSMHDLGFPGEASAPSLADAKIAVISTDEGTLDSLIRSLESRGPTVRHFPNLEAWLAAIADDDPFSADRAPFAWDDCLVLHLPLDNEASLPTIKKASQRRFGLPIVVLATTSSLKSAVAAMRAGALIVLEAAIPQDELWSAIREALHQSTAKRRQLQYITQLRERLATLSDGEQSVLQLLLHGNANKKIAQLLEIGLRTAELRRSRIMTKMQARSLAELVRMTFEARSGMVMPYDSPRSDADD